MEFSNKRNVTTKMVGLLAVSGSDQLVGSQIGRLSSLRVVMLKC